MPGYKTFDSYKKYSPESILTCLACGKEFVPALENRSKTASTCSMECSKIFCRLKPVDKLKAKEKWRP